MSLFDAGTRERCSAVAAGMLSPVAELATAQPGISKLGMGSIPLWEKWLGELGEPSTIRNEGSLFVAHERDTGELGRVVSMLREKIGDGKKIIKLDPQKIARLEPCLSHIKHGYLIPDEACVDAERAMDLLRKGCDSAGVDWHDGISIDSVGKGTLAANGRPNQCDWACDCRGLGAKKDLPLRPVRGEIIHLESDEVALGRPVRIAHPRHCVYLVPRARNRILVGATEIESCDETGVSVRSALELLGAAYALVPQLAEARITDMRVGLRPALPDNEPICDASDGKILINGMYRHGFLVAPALVQKAISAMGLD